MPNTTKLYLDTLKSLEQNINVVIMGAMISKYLSDLSNIDEINQYKVCTYLGRRAVDNGFLFFRVL